MATQIDFTKAAKLLDLHTKKKQGMYRHNGDKYPGLHLTVGVRKTAWSFRGRINGKVRSLNLGAFPSMTVDQAFKQIEKTAQHHGNETTTTIRSVLDAWQEYRRGATSKVATLNDLEVKLKRHAGAILSAKPDKVSFADVRHCLLDIESISTRHHVKAAINNAYSVLDIESPIPRGKLKAKQLGKVGRRPTLWKELCDSNDAIDRHDWSPMWTAINSVKNAARRTAWIVMLFTGIRSNDVRSLRWDQVDLDRATIRLDDMKNGETRTIPICQTVVDVLKAFRGKGEYVFPAKSKTGYIDHLDILSATINENTHKVLRQHDTRHHFTSACAPANVPSYAAAFLRGDITSANRDDDMLMHYQEDLDLTPQVADIEKVILERLGNPSF